MIYNYSGHYPYNTLSVLANAPDEIGVYYCGFTTAGDNSLKTHYVGRAKGTGVTIRSRLLDHLRGDSWPGVTYFGYCVCTTEKEAEDFEAAEILRIQPTYNIQGKTYSR